MGNNYGYQNEYDFVELFNDKYISDLDRNSQKFINDIFEDVFDYNEKIYCWKNKMNQKTDIFIKHKNYIKNISLKCGNNNSVHQEPLQEFRRYLEKIGIAYKTIDKYVSYHYGYKKDDLGNTDFSISLSSDQYKELYQNDIDIFNNSINKTRIIVDMIDRFIIYGRYADYGIDALICGTVNNYVWIKRYDLYDLILFKRCNDFTSPHIACLTIGPKMRNLNNSSTNLKDKYVVCVRWNFIRESIISFKR